VFTALYKINSLSKKIIIKAAVYEIGSFIIKLLVLIFGYKDISKYLFKR